MTLRARFKTFGFRHGKDYGGKLLPYNVELRPKLNSPYLGQ